MQLFEIKNDIAKILYTPSKNHLLLADFLLIEDVNQSLIAQIIDIESTDNDDANIATVKFSLSINKNANLSTYNGYTPSKNSNIIYIEPIEIAQLIQSTKANIYWGNLAAHPKTEIHLGLSLLRENPCIKCDKTENATIISNNILIGLHNNKRRALVIDFDGRYKKIDNANKIKISQEFKLPLNYDAFDFIAEYDLDDCPIENKAIIQGILLELQGYVAETEDKFIPFDVFKSVIDEQCNQNPIPELLIFKNKLIKYQQKGLFAQEKPQFDLLNKILSNSTINIIDASHIDEKWHRFIIETIAQLINKKCYFVVNLNDNNSTKTTLDYLYNNSDLRVIPTVSYAYKYLSYIDSVCKNMILFAPNEKINDFEVYNSFLEKLNQKEFIIWSENTFYMPVIIKLKAFEKDAVTKAISDQIKDDVDKMFTVAAEETSSVILPTVETGNIELELEPQEFEAEDELQNTNAFEIEISEPEETIDEVQEIVPIEGDINIDEEIHINLDAEPEMIVQEIVLSPAVETVETVDEAEVLETIESVDTEANTDDSSEEYYDEPIIDNITDEDLDYLDNVSLDEVFSTINQQQETNETKKEVAVSNNSEVLIEQDFSQLLVEEYNNSIILDEEETGYIDESQESVELIDPEIYIDQEDSFEYSTLLTEDTDDYVEVEESAAMEQIEPVEQVQIAIEEPDQVSAEKVVVQDAVIEPDFVNDENTTVQIIAEEVEEIPEETTEELDENDTYVAEAVISEAQPVQEETIIKDIQETETIQEAAQEAVPEEQTIEESDVSAVIEQEEFNSNPEETKQEASIPSAPPPAENIKIPQKPSVPIYEAKINSEIEKPKTIFEEGNFVSHPKYGKGIVEKIITYGNKTLCSIQFDNVGRRLLDPNLADIKLA